MKLTELFIESLRSARAAKTPTFVVALLAASVCAATGVTVARTAAAEAQVAARMEEAGARHLSVIDGHRLNLFNGEMIHRVAQLNVVERAVGLTTAVDVVNAHLGAGGIRVPAWQAVGNLADVLELTAGRWPNPGEALVSAGAQRELGLAAPAGAITGASPAAADATAPVVGQFVPRAPFETLNAGVVIYARPNVIPSRLEVVATCPATAISATDAVLAIIGPVEIGALTVSSPVTLAQIHQEVLGDLTTFNRALALLVLAGGSALVAVVAFADVLTRRAEIGRRRALGLPRWGLITLLVTRSALSSVVGAAVGTVVAVAVGLHDGHLPAATFLIATMVLAVIANAASTVLPALFAAYQDPVRTLRTP